jgi:hypothetical protein
VPKPSYIRRRGAYRTAQPLGVVNNYAACPTINPFTPLSPTRPWKYELRNQLANLDATWRRLAEEREAFVKVMRREMGKKVVQLVLEIAELRTRE